MAKIVIFGDSFACDTPGSWCDILSRDNIVRNYAQAGASEYRIWQQWQRHRDQPWDHALICHTSPNRIYCAENFFHDPLGLHRHADLIYQDVKSRPGDSRAQHVSWWFENVFDLDQAAFVHGLLIQHWINGGATNVHHITFFDLQSPALHNLHEIWQEHPGPINHLSDQGNNKVVEHVKHLLQCSAS